MQSIVEAGVLHVASQLAVVQTTVRECLPTQRSRRFLGITEGRGLGKSGSPMNDNCGVLVTGEISGMLSTSPAVAWTEDGDDLAGSEEVRGSEAIR